MSDIPTDIREILEKSVGANLDNFIVENHEKNKEGEGYLSDLLFLSLTNRETNAVHHLVIKQALPCGTPNSGAFISKLFYNEITFYDKIWLGLERFQEKHRQVAQFSGIPKFYAANTIQGGEKLSIENMKYRAFRNHDKNTFFSSGHLTYILKAYGRFHAASMAYRMLEPDNFGKLSDLLVDNFVRMGDMHLFQQIINLNGQQMLSTLDQKTDKLVIEEFKVYAERGSRIFQESMRYKGSNKVITHGDSWSNNLMFKYDEAGDIDDLKLVDFQFSRIGTVVYDLSFFLYTGASKETLDNLDYYLRLYHGSLTESLKAYGLDPERVYPYDALKQEWKEYSKFGFIMALFNYSLKNAQSVDSVLSFVDLIDEEEREIGHDQLGIVTEKYKENVRNLVLHVYKHDSDKRKESVES